MNQRALDHAMRIDYVRNVVELIDLVLRGSTIKDAAAEVGLSYQSAREICLAAGVNSEEAASKKKAEARRAIRNSSYPKKSRDSMSAAAERRYADPEERARARARALAAWSKRRLGREDSSPPER